MLTNKWYTAFGISILALSLTACTDLGENNNIEKDQNNIINNESEDEEHNGLNKDESDELEQNEQAEKDTNDQDLTDEEEQDPTITALVNKEYSLDETYAPSDLVTVDVPTVLENPEVNQLRKVAADALREMFEKAKESDIHLQARSGYRSYQTQVNLFQANIEKNGEEAANRYSAKPGESEHQTGLVMDITSESVNYQLTEAFGETEEGKWVKEHAHEFGFIIRYPEGAEDITGYIYEPWHLRYLGIDMATDVFKSGLTYEEYLEEEGLIHEVSS